MKHSIFRHRRCSIIGNMIFDGEDVAVCRECETIWNLTKSGWKPEGLIEQKPTWKGKPKSAKPKQARRAVSSFDPGEDS